MNNDAFTVLKYSSTLEYSIIWEKNPLPPSVTLLVYATTNNNKTGTIQWFEEW